MTYEPEKMKKIPFTGIRRVLERANQLAGEGRKIVHFEIGQPDFDTPANIKEAAKKALDDRLTSYSSNFGIPQLRKAIAAKLSRQNDLTVNADTDIMVTVGGEEAVAASVFALLDADDEVLIAQPCYFPYVSLVRLACAKPVMVPLVEEDGYNYDFDALEKAVTSKTRMLILNSPGNPTGSLMDREHLTTLAAFCEKHDLLVVADEAYEQVLYDGNRHITFASLPGMWERTVTVQSFSKAYSMCGWRIGYIAATRELLRVIVRAHMNIVMSANTFSQYGALEALTGPQDSLRAMLAQFNKRRIALYDALTGIGIPCSKPQAAFYLFPNISQFGMDSFAFAEHLLEHYGVATVPGVEFGQLGEGHIRISYATSFEDCMAGADAIRRMAEALRASNRLS